MSDQHYGDIKNLLKIIESRQSIQNNALVISDSMFFSIMDKNKKLEQENKQLREALDFVTIKPLTHSLHELPYVKEIRKHFNLDEVKE